MRHQSDSLKTEFVTVDAVLKSEGSTRRVDAFILTWVKMEKQLRRIFCFLVFQAPIFSEQNIDEVIQVLANNKKLYFATFIQGIDKLRPSRVRDIIGSGYDNYVEEIGRIQLNRNKILHGQVTAKRITSPQLEKDIRILRDWIGLVAKSSEATFGYDGLARNTFNLAKTVQLGANREYPFTTLDEFSKWLGKVTKNASNANAIT